MSIAFRFLLLCAILLVLPTIADAQPVPLAVERVWTQDASGNGKTTFAPGETIQFAAQLNNSYGGALLGAPITITTPFYNNTKTIDIPNGVSTQIWNATAPSAWNTYVITVKAYDSFYGRYAEGSANVTVAPTHVAFAYGPLKRIATYGTGADPGSAQAAAEAACQQQGGGSDCQGVGWWTYGYASFALNASMGKWGWGADQYQITIADSEALNRCGTNCSLIYRLGVGGSAPYQSSDLSPVRGTWTIGGYSPGQGDHVGRDLYAVDFFSDNPAIYPVRPGKVVFSDWNCCVSGHPCQPRDVPYTDRACYGYVIAIDHGGGIYSIYTHLGADGRAAYGQQVTPQSRIGTMSTAGCLASICGSQPHLHFAVRNGLPNLETNALYGGNQTPVLTPWTP